MNNVKFLFPGIFLALALVVTAAGAEIDTDYFQKMPHNLLTPDYYQPNPNPLEPLDDTVNVRVNSDNSGQIQNEQQLCINPTNPDNVVAVWRDFRLGYRRVGIGYSFDGGLTWTDNLFPVTGRPWHSDPGLTYDIYGNFYTVVLAYEPDQSYSGFEVFKSTNGGVTWGNPTVAIDGVPNVFEDKELIACDRTPGSPYQGNLYIAWTRFYSTNIHVIRSTDGNNSWSSPVRISDAGGVQWPNPVVGADGVVYVAWVSYYDDIRLDRSYNGGASWGSDINITDIYTASDYINGSILVFSYPALDADISGGEYHGNLYLAYMDRTSGDYDIYFRRSTNEGSSWSSAARLNDDSFNNGRDQFHPWLVVDENGVITVMFYDRRNDPNNLLYDIYITQSSDAGYTWTENQRVTTVSSNPTTLTTAGLIGEYSGLSVRNGVANLAWTDFRLGDQDTYSARIETYSASDLSIEMIPDETPPVYVIAGGSFSYTGVLANNTGQQQVSDVWVNLTIPGGGSYGPVQEFYNVVLNPNQQISVPDIIQDVPGFAPEGTYNYIANCGNYPSDIIDSDTFQFIVYHLGDGAETGGDWKLAGWFDNDSYELPRTSGLLGNYPNPFNASTTIRYTLTDDRDVSLKVYNLMGELVEILVGEHKTAGNHSVRWDGTQMASGIYYYKLTVGDESYTKRMTLLK
ncbi:MAG: T9SS type A sorting domain-containing protein [candidate division Zixibacteria bacterium]|nr:T9SS type A sorting domain-containing protein [candidate division Zixibacteria bacterium]